MKKDRLSSALRLADMSALRLADMSALRLADMSALRLAVPVMVSLIILSTVTVVRAETRSVDSTDTEKIAAEAPRLLDGKTVSLHRAADEQMSLGNSNGAASLYARAALLAPSDALLRLMTGVALSALPTDDPNRKRAVGQFRAAVRLADDDPLAALLLQGALSDQGETAEAQTLWLESVRRFARPKRSVLDMRRSQRRLNEAIKQFPLSPALYLLLGDAHQIAQETDQADIAYRRAINLAPRWAKPRVNYALSRLQQGYADAAIRLFNQALALDPQNAQAQVGKGDAQLQSGRPAEAIRTYQVASNQSRSKVSALTGMGNAYLQLRRPEEAIRTLDKAHKLDPQNPTTTVALADVQIQMGNYAAGAKSYETALELINEGGLFSARPIVYRALIESQMSAGKPLEALQSVQRALGNDPNNAPLWNRLAAHIYFEMHNEPDAQSALRRALDSWVSLPGTSALYPQEILTACAAHNLLDTVGVWYRVAESGAGNRADAYTVLAHLARYNGQADEEIRLRELAVKASGSSANWYLLAETYDLKKNDGIRARPAYRKALLLGGLPDSVTDAAKRRLAYRERK